MGDTIDLIEDEAPSRKSCKYYSDFCLNYTLVEKEKIYVRLHLQEICTLESLRSRNYFSAALSFALSLR